MASYFAPCFGGPAAARAHPDPLADGSPPGEPEQRDQRFRVVALGDRIVEPVERPRDDLDPLVLVRLRGFCAVGQPGREVEPYPLVAEAGARVEGEDFLPSGRLLADLLGELSFGG